MKRTRDFNRAPVARPDQFRNELLRDHFAAAD
jgi:hypothetical protein